jgi:hypothetical protein
LTELPNFDASGWLSIYGTLPPMAPGKQPQDTSWLPTVVPTVQALLNRCDATRGLAVKTWGGYLILGRVDEVGPVPRFRLTPLGDGRYGLSLYNHNRWDPLPYEGPLDELVDILNHDLRAWAVEWAEPPAIGP